MDEQPARDMIPNDAFKTLSICDTTDTLSKARQTP